MDVALYRLSIPFAIVTGCIAGVFAALTWEVLRDSPFGSGLKLFAVVMSLATIYHGGLLVTGQETLLLQTLLVLVYILTLLAFVIVLIEFRHWFGDYSGVKHPQLLIATVLGVLMYSIGGPVSELYFPSFLHWIHGFAALSIIGGLYAPVHDDLQTSPWGDLLLRNAEDYCKPAEWMRTIDDAILEVLAMSGLILTPSVIAYNIDYCRDEVNRRLTVLEREGLVERVERGKYRLTSRGEQYLEGRDQPSPQTK